MAAGKKSTEQHLDQLRVYVAGALAGLIHRGTSQTIRFIYSDSWVEKGGYALSLSLPLHEAESDSIAATQFFENLLPETSVRTEIARSNGVSDRNIYSLLEALGEDCAGAISIFAETRPAFRDARYEPVSLNQLDTIVAGLERAPLGTSQSDLRLSLAGAQQKLPIFYDGKTFSLTYGGAPSTHIIKPALGLYQGSVENEAFCMKLAAELDLNVPRCEVFTGLSAPVYLVERYDRFLNLSNDIVRVHQEDFCQALGIFSSEKYEKERGPGFARCFSLLGEHSVRPVQDQQMLLDWALFNLLVGNADAHGKNISLLHYPDGPVLAPFYDLLSTAIYPELKRDLAMGIGGKRDPDYLFPVHWRRFAESLGVKQRLITSRAERLIENVGDAISRVTAEMHGSPEAVRVIEQVEKMVSKRVLVLRSA